MISIDGYRGKYKSLQRREVTYLVLNWMLITNTESESNIFFSIKSLIKQWENLLKISSRIKVGFFVGNNLAIIEYSNYPTTLN